MKAGYNAKNFAQGQKLSYSLFEPSSVLIDKDLWEKDIFVRLPISFWHFPLLAVSKTYYAAIQRKLISIVFASPTEANQDYQKKIIDDVHRRIGSLKARNTGIIKELENTLLYYIKNPSLHPQICLKASIILQVMSVDDLSLLQAHYCTIVRKHIEKCFVQQPCYTQTASNIIAMDAMFAIFSDDSLSALYSDYLMPVFAKQTLEPLTLFHWLPLINVLIAKLPAPHQQSLAEQFYLSYKGLNWEQKEPPFEHSLATVFLYLHETNQRDCLARYDFLPPPELLVAFMKNTIAHDWLQEKIRRICLGSRWHAQHKKAITLACMAPGILTAKEVMLLLPKPDKEPLVDLLNSEQCQTLIEPALASLEIFWRTKTEANCLYYSLPKLLAHLPNAKNYDVAVRLVQVFDTLLVPDDDYFDFHVSLTCLIDVIIPKLSEAQNHALLSFVKNKRRACAVMESPGELMQCEALDLIQNLLIVKSYKNIQDCPTELAQWFTNFQQKNAEHARKQNTLSELDHELFQAMMTFALPEGSEASLSTRLC